MTTPLIEIVSRAVWIEEGHPVSDDCRYYHAHADAVLRAITEAGYAVVPVEPTEAMIEDGADAWNKACAAQREDRRLRNDKHEAAGRGRPAEELHNFPADWLAETYRAMIQAAQGDGE